MAEMSLERACEILRAQKHRGLKWSLLVRHAGDAAVLGEDASGRSYYLHPDDAVAVAEKLLRLAAPPAERAGGRLSGNSGQLGEAAEILGRLAGRLTDGQPIGVYNGLGGKVAMTAGALRALLAAAERGAGAEKAYMAREHEIEQTLGKALGYPRLKDDPKNFPDATEKDGACVGDHTAASLADEAAERIAKLQASLAERGPGAEAGPATRRVMEVLRQHQQGEAERTPREYGVVVWPSEWDGGELTHADVSAALAELNMEPPR